MKWDALRTGQREAVRTIIDRYMAGERTTAIVLPTRYGKSDVMRVAALELWRDGKLSCALALSPNLTLRDQLGSTEKWKQALNRYGLTDDILVRSLAEATWRPSANGEIFLSATIQMVERNMGMFTDEKGWINHLKHTTGWAPLIFVDESHTGSEDNRWGEITEEFANLGCHIVLLTATHRRSDGKRIPGFKTVVFDPKPVTVTKVKPGSTPKKVRVEIYKGESRLLELIPDHYTSFQEAWQDHLLCLINRIPFDVELSRIEGGSIEQGLMLSDLENKAEVQRAVSRAVRSAIVIEEGARRLVRQLRRRQLSKSDIAAIVFCGNDDDKDDPATNKHAEQIKAAILRLDPLLKVIIATSANEGKTQLEAFAKGVGDVLIVKQMASLGLDIERLKVGLDLSPVRTPAAYIQRMMRIATLYGMIGVCDWISVDDLLSRALFEDLIRGVGGAARGMDLELDKAYEKDKEEASDPTYFDIGDTTPADFEDSELRRADKSRWDIVEAILEIVPWALERTTHAKLAESVEGSSLRVEPHRPDTGRVRDPGVEMGRLRTEINELADQIVNARMTNGEYDQVEWAHIRRQVFGDAYQFARIRHGLKLKDIDDIEDLKRIKVFLLDILRVMGQVPQ